MAQDSRGKGKKNAQEDPYRVLGVKKDAPENEIRGAYRRMALRLHPGLALCLIHL